jgi:hypothetical protein
LGYARSRSIHTAACTAVLGRLTPAGPESVSFFWYDRVEAASVDEAMGGQ